MSLPEILVSFGRDGNGAGLQKTVISFFWHDDNGRQIGDALPLTRLPVPVPEEITIMEDEERARCVRSALSAPGAGPPPPELRGGASVVDLVTFARLSIHDGCRTLFSLPHAGTGFEHPFSILYIDLNPPDGVRLYLGSIRGYIARAHTSFECDRIQDGLKGFHTMIITSDEFSIPGTGRAKCGARVGYHGPAAQIAILRQVEHASASAIRADKLFEQGRFTADTVALCEAFNAQLYLFARYGCRQMPRLDFQPMDLGMSFAAVAQLFTAHGGPGAAPPPPPPPPEFLRAGAPPPPPVVLPPGGCPQCNSPNIGYWRFMMVCPNCGFTQ